MLNHIPKADKDSGRAKAVRIRIVVMNELHGGFFFINSLLYDECFFLPGTKY
jgi:hypothetical protein